MELAVLPNLGKGRHRQLLDPGLLARSAAGQYISVPLSHLVCGITAVLENPCSLFRDLREELWGGKAAGRGWETPRSMKGLDLVLEPPTGTHSGPADVVRGRCTGQGQGSQ